MNNSHPPLSGILKKKPFYRKPWFLILITVVSLFVVIRLALTPVLSWYVSNTMSKIQGINIEIKQIHLSVYNLTCELDTLTVREKPVNQKKEPLLRLKKLTAALSWRELFRGNLTFTLYIEDAKAVWTVRQPIHQELEQQWAHLKKLLHIKTFADLRNIFIKLPSLRLDRLEIRNTEFLLNDLYSKLHPKLWIHRIEMTLENLANRRELSDGRPAIFALTGIVQKSGALSVFATFDPMTRTTRFAGQTELLELNLEHTYAFVASYTDIYPAEGTLDVFATFRVNDNFLVGGIKPLITNMRIKAVEDNAGSKIKAGLANIAIKMFTDEDVKKGRRLAAMIPLRGNLETLTVEIMPVIKSILANSSGRKAGEKFADLPTDSYVRPKQEDMKTEISGKDNDAITRSSKQHLPPIARTPHGTLKYGAAEKIQQALTDKGFKIKKSGYFGPSTRRIVREFQIRENIASTGFPDQLTLQRLNLSPAEVFLKAR